MQIVNNDLFSSKQFQSQQQVVYKNKIDDTLVSILKYLQPAREIMQKSIHCDLISSTKCMYLNPLCKVTESLSQQTNSNINKNINSNRLLQLEDVLYDHSQMKQKVQQIYMNKVFKQVKYTLYKLYCKRIPIYSRFYPAYRKQNFANVFMNIVGVELALDNITKILKIKNGSSSNNAHKNQTYQKQSIIFDSNFQSGNLLYVYKNQKQSNEMEIQSYDLILQNDVNTKGHNQWFFFRVMTQNRCQRVRFNIVNLIKPNSLFNHGMKPLIFSQKIFTKHGIGWFRSGQRINYDQNNICRQNINKSYYSLSFQYNFADSNDVVYFAPVLPYTYTQLNKFLLKSLKNLGKNWQKIACLKNITETIGGNQVSVLSLSTGRKDIKDCGVIWIFGRQHPGQTTSSFMIQGIITCLLNRIMEARKSSYASQMDNYIFKIVPMVNVDGVIHGNTRTQLSGVDPNRTWNKPPKKISPVIYTLKKKILASQKNLSMVLDLHSHSRKTGCFLYGNYFNYDLKISKIFPSIVCEDDPRFCLKNCRFQGGYPTTARRVLFEELKSPFIYTVECSMLGYVYNNRIIEYTTNDYKQMGVKLVNSFFKMQLLKNTQSTNEIIQQYVEKVLDIVDVQSAKSQSNLSDQQYNQIYKMQITREKIKKKGAQKYLLKKRDKKCKTKDLHSLTSNKICSKSNKETEYSNKENKDRSLLQKIDTNMNIGNSLTNPSMNQNRVRKVQKNNTDTYERIKYKQVNSKIDKYSQQQKIESMKKTIPIESFLISTKVKKKQEWGTQIDRQYIDDRSAHNSAILCPNKENVLCVVGNSLEDDKLWIGDNEVCIQIDSKQIISAVEIALKKSSNSKLPKNLASIYGNRGLGLMKENAMLPQEKLKIRKFTKILPTIIHN